MRWSVRELVKRFGVPGLFILAFMVLLVVAAVLLAVGWENLANRCAEVAYYCLVIGVVGRLVELVLESRRSRERSE